MCIFILSTVENVKITDLYQKFNKLIYKYAYDILKNEQDTEDVVQTTFIKLSKNLNKINTAGERKIINFMITIAKNAAIDIYNSRKKQGITYLDDFEVTQGTEDFKYNELTSADMKEAIYKLDEEYKDILLLKYIYGYTVLEISRFLNITETNATTKIYRAKLKLKKILSERGGF